MILNYGMEANQKGQHSKQKMLVSIGLATFPVFNKEYHPDIVNDIAQSHSCTQVSHSVLFTVDMEFVSQPSHIIFFCIEYFKVLVYCYHIRLEEFMRRVCYHCNVARVSTDVTNKIIVYACKRKICGWFCTIPNIRLLPGVKLLFLMNTSNIW